MSESEGPGRSERFVAPLTELSRDVLLAVLQRLDPDSLASVCCTCHRLNNVASDPALWRQICSDRWWHPNSTAFPAHQPQQPTRPTLHHGTIDPPSQQQHQASASLPCHSQSAAPTTNTSSRNTTTSTIPIVSTTIDWKALYAAGNGWEPPSLAHAVLQPPGDFISALQPAPEPLPGGGRLLALADSGALRVWSLHTDRNGHQQHEQQEQQHQKKMGQQLPLKRASEGVMEGLRDTSGERGGNDAGHDQECGSRGERRKAVVAPGAAAAGCEGQGAGGGGSGGGSSPVRVEQVGCAALHPRTAVHSLAWVPRVEGARGDTRKTRETVGSMARGGHGGGMEASSSGGRGSGVGCVPAGGSGSSQGGAAGASGAGAVGLGEDFRQQWVVAAGTHEGTVEWYGFEGPAGKGEAAQGERRGAVDGRAAGVGVGKEVDVDGYGDGVEAAQQLELQLLHTTGCGSPYPLVDLHVMGTASGLVDATAFDAVHSCCGRAAAGLATAGSTTGLSAGDAAGLPAGAAGVGFGAKLGGNGGGGGGGGFLVAMQDTSFTMGGPGGGGGAVGAARNAVQLYDIATRRHVARIADPWVAGGRWCRGLVVLVLTVTRGTRSGGAGGEYSLRWTLAVGLHLCTFAHNAAAWTVAWVALLTAQARTLSPAPYPHCQRLPLALLFPACALGLRATSSCAAAPRLGRAPAAQTPMCCWWGRCTAASARGWVGGGTKGAGRLGTERQGASCGCCPRPGPWTRAPMPGHVPVRPTALVPYQVLPCTAQSIRSACAEAAQHARTACAAPAPSPPLPSHPRLSSQCYEQGMPSLCFHKPRSATAALLTLDLRCYRPEQPTTSSSSPPPGAGLAQRFSLHHRSLYPRLVAVREHYVLTSHAGSALVVHDRRAMSAPLFELGHLPRPHVAPPGVHAQGEPQGMQQQEQEGCAGGSGEAAAGVEGRGEWGEERGGSGLPGWRRWLEPWECGVEHQGLWLEADGDVLLGRAENGEDEGRAGAGAGAGAGEGGRKFAADDVVSVVEADELACDGWSTGSLKVLQRMQAFVKPSVAQCDRCCSSDA